MKFSHKIMVGAFSAGLAVWVGDALLDYFLFFEHSFLELLITEVPAHELYIRLLIMVLFLSFGGVISYYVHRLSVSRGEYLSLFMEAPVGIFRTTSDGEILNVNPAFAEIVGCESPQQVKEEYTELARDFYVVPERRRDFLNELQSTGTITGFEARGYRLDGTEFWFELQARVNSVQEDGEFEISGYLRDITERKENEAKVRHLNQVLRAIRDVNQLIAWENDRKKLISRACGLLTESGAFSSSFVLLLNEEQEPAEAACAGLDKSSEELVEEYRAGKLAPCGEEVLQAASPSVTRQEADSCEECVLEAEHAGQTTAVVSLIHEGRVYGLLAVQVPEMFVAVEEDFELLEEVGMDLSYALKSIEDEKRRRAAEKRLARSRRNLKTTLNAIGDGLISADTEGKVVRMNPVAEELTGWDFEAAKGQPIDEVFNIVNTNTGEPVENPVEEVLASGKIVGLANHTTLIARDGTKHQIADSGAPIKGPEGEINGVVLVFRDITEEYEMREKIRRSEKRYRALFNQMNEGVALHELVYDENGEPVDYRLLEVNEKFEEIIGVEAEAVENEKATEVYEPEEPPYLDRYQEVAQGAGPIEFVNYYPPLDKHFHTSVFSPEPGKFATVFLDITQQKKVQADLEESEQRYRRLFETAQDGMLILNAETGEVKDANPYIQDILGYSKEELVGKQLWEIGTFQDVVKNQERFEELIDAGYVRYEDLPLETKAGEEAPVEFVSNTYAAGGERVVQCNIRDISRRKSAEKKLEERHRQLQTLFGNLPGMAYRCQNDRKWTMEFLSEGAEELTGYEPEELLDSSEISYGDLIVEEDREAVWNQVQAAVEQQKPFKLTYRIRSKDGEKKWVWEQGEGIFSKSGELQFLEGFITDITAREKVKRRLREEKKFLNQVLETTPVGIVVFDQAGRLEQVNERALDIFDRSESEVIGLRYDDESWQLFDSHGEPVDHEDLPSTEVIESGETAYQRELGIRQSDGDEVWLSISMAPVRDESGNIVRAVAALEDITRRREMEAEIREALEEKEVMLQEIHHRVKNNLQVICSLLDMRARTAISEAEKPLIETRNRVNSMALIHDRIYQSETPSAVNIENYLEELTAGLRNTYERGQQEIQVELEVDESIRLELDLAVPCALILNELLANTFEHAFPAESEKEKIVRISCQREGPEFDFQLKISDNGQGMPEDYEIGELGQRDTLGLGLVKALVEKQLEGELEVNSTPGKGTKFVVRF